MSELFRADGVTLHSRFTTNLAERARRCESDAIRLCDIAFGRGRGPGNQSGRPRVGAPLPAAWDGVTVGSYTWRSGELGRVSANRHAGAAVSVFTAGAAPRRATTRTNVKFTMSRSEVFHYDSPPLLVDTATVTTSGCVSVRHHEVQALRAVEVQAASPPDLRFVATCSVPPSTAGWPDIQQEPSRVDSDDATTPLGHTRYSRGAATTVIVCHKQATCG